MRVSMITAALLACLTAPADAKTITANLTNLVDDPIAWTILGIGPQTEATFSVTFDDTAPSSVTTMGNTTVGYVTEQRAYNVTGYELQIGSLTVGGPITDPTASGGISTVTVQDVLLGASFGLRDSILINVFEPTIFPNGSQFIEFNGSISFPTATADLAQFPSETLLNSGSSTQGSIQVATADGLRGATLFSPDVTFSVADGQPQIAPVPLPAAGWMLLAGVLALGALRARHPNRVAAA